MLSIIISISIYRFNVKLFTLSNVKIIQLFDLLNGRIYTIKTYLRILLTGKLLTVNDVNFIRRLSYRNNTSFITNDTFNKVSTEITVIFLTFKENE